MHWTDLKFCLWKVCMLMLQNQLGHKIIQTRIEYGKHPLHYPTVPQRTASCEDMDQGKTKIDSFHSQPWCIGELRDRTLWSVSLQFTELCFTPESQWPSQDETLLQWKKMWAAVSGIVFSNTSGYLLTLWCHENVQGTHCQKQHGSLKKCLNLCFTEVNVFLWQKKL